MAWVVRYQSPNSLDRYGYAEDAVWAYTSNIDEAMQCHRYKDAEAFRNLMSAARAEVVEIK